MSASTALFELGSVLRGFRFGASRRHEQRFPECKPEVTFIRQSTSAQESLRCQLQSTSTTNSSTLLVRHRWAWPDRECSSTIPVLCSEPCQLKMTSWSRVLPRSILNRQPQTMAPTFSNAQGKLTMLHVVHASCEVVLCVQDVRSSKSLLMEGLSIGEKSKPATSKS